MPIPIPTSTKGEGITEFPEVQRNLPEEENDLS
jgi:hypothetical protein